MVAWVIERVAGRSIRCVSAVGQRQNTECFCDGEQLYLSMSEARNHRGRAQLTPPLPSSLTYHERENRNPHAYKASSPTSRNQRQPPTSTSPPPKKKSELKRKDSSPPPPPPTHKPASPKPKSHALAVMRVRCGIENPPTPNVRCRYSSGPGQVKNDVEAERGTCTQHTDFLLGVTDSACLSIQFREVHTYPVKTHFVVVVVGLSD